MPQGVILDNYIKNPVVSAFHKYDKPSIGRGLQIGVGEDFIVSKMEFPPEGMYEDADVLHDLYKSGFQHAASIGFMAKDAEYNELGGKTFNSWELFEFALVLVPDNPEALRLMRDKGVNPGSFFKDIEDAETEKKAADEKEAKEKADAEKKAANEKIAENTKLTEDLQKKDVGEVISLAYCLSCLNYYIQYFEEQKVNEEDITKLKQALALVLEVTKNQAELGKKGITGKSGRTISAKHEAMLKDCVDMHKKCMDNLKAVLDTVKDDTTDDDEGDKNLSSSMIKRLSASLKVADQSTGFALHILKNMRKSTPPASGDERSKTK
jgi:hypothetical protein